MPTAVSLLMSRRRRRRTHSTVPAALAETKFMSRSSQLNRSSTRRRPARARTHGSSACQARTAARAHAHPLRCQEPSRQGTGSRCQKMLLQSRWRCRRRVRTALARPSTGVDWCAAGVGKSLRARRGGAATPQTQPLDPSSCRREGGGGRREWTVAASEHCVFGTHTHTAPPPFAQEQNVVVKRQHRSSAHGRVHFEPVVQAVCRLHAHPHWHSRQRQICSAAGGRARAAPLRQLSAALGATRSRAPVAGSGGGPWFHTITSSATEGQRL